LTPFVREFSESDNSDSGNDSSGKETSESDKKESSQEVAETPLPSEVGRELLKLFEGCKQGPDVLDVLEKVVSISSAERSLARDGHDDGKVRVSKLGVRYFKLKKGELEPGGFLHRKPLGWPEGDNCTTKWENVNPQQNFDFNPKVAKFFVCKSSCEENIVVSIHEGIWASTEAMNKRLDDAYRQLNGAGPLYMLFSVAGSQIFCGVAEMIGPLDWSVNFDQWVEQKMFEEDMIVMRNFPQIRLKFIVLASNL
jgi:hypothetical protein